MQIKFGTVNLLESNFFADEFLFSTRRAAQIKKFEFLSKLVALNVCARGSRDFPATAVRRILRTRFSYPGFLSEFLIYMYSGTGQDSNSL